MFELQDIENQKVNQGWSSEANDFKEPTNKLIFPNNDGCKFSNQNDTSEVLEKNNSDLHLISYEENIHSEDHMNNNKAEHIKQLESFMGQTNLNLMLPSNQATVCGPKPGF